MCEDCVFINCGLENEIFKQFLIYGGELQFFSLPGMTGLHQPWLFPILFVHYGYSNN
jgi:hypothetical protein